MNKIFYITVIFLLVFSSFAFAFTYSGNGDDYFRIEKPDDIALILISGNSSNRHFAVQGVDKTGNNTKLFVNTTERYVGMRPLDFLDRNNTTHLEVKASGDWEIEILPVSKAQKLNVGSRLVGMGDEVIQFTDISGEPSSAYIKGNEDGKHFSVTAWGNRRKLLVNTVDKYDGTVRITPPIYFLEITAPDLWEITLN
jgi:hypothetical protein